MNPVSLCPMLYCSILLGRKKTVRFRINDFIMIVISHIIVEALLGSNLTLVVVLQVERHQVQHVPQRGGAGLLTEHLPVRGET